VYLYPLSTTITMGATPCPLRASLLRWWWFMWYVVGQKVGLIDNYSIEIEGLIHICLPVEVVVVCGLCGMW
jgi:hypothetical protein